MAEYGFHKKPWTRKDFEESLTADHAREEIRKNAEKILEIVRGVDKIFGVESIPSVCEGQPLNDHSVEIMFKSMGQWHLGVFITLWGSVEYSLSKYRQGDNEFIEHFNNRTNSCSVEDMLEDIRDRFEGEVGSIEEVE